MNYISTLLEYFLLILLITAINLCVSLIWNTIQCCYYVMAFKFVKIITYFPFFINFIETLKFFNRSIPILQRYLQYICSFFSLRIFSYLQNSLQTSDLLCFRDLLWFLGRPYSQIGKHAETKILLPWRKRSQLFFITAALLHYLFSKFWSLLAFLDLGN